MSGSIQLSRQLVLEAAATENDGAGGTTNSWTELGVIWAQISVRTARARELNLGDTAQTRLRIIVRSAPVGTSNRPKPEQRFREGSRIYMIDAVAEKDPSGLYLECWAREEVMQ